jgi:hypothetical protein
LKHGTISVNIKVVKADMQYDSRDMMLLERLIYSYREQTCGGQDLGGRGGCNYKRLA